VIAAAANTDVTGNMMTAAKVATQAAEKILKNLLILTNTSHVYSLAQKSSFLLQLLSSI
jgi:hypothetical protein